MDGPRSRGVLATVSGSAQPSPNHREVTMMTAQAERLPANTAEVFPAQDHFPLGRPFGVVDGVE